MRPTDVAYLSLANAAGYEGVTEAGIRFRIDADHSVYNVHYTAVRISFERPVRAFGFLAAMSGAFSGFGAGPQVGFSAGGAVIDVGQGGYVGFLSPSTGVSSVLVTSRSGEVAASHLDLRPEPLARDDRITIVTEHTAMISPDRILGNDSLGSGAIVGEGPKHAEIFHLSPDGLLTYRPVAGYTGTDRFSYSAIDAAGETASNPAWVEIEVVEPAAAPSWAMASHLEVEEDAGPQRYSEWAVIGGFGQIEFDVHTDRPDLFASQPTMDAEGALSFESAPNANGETMLTISLRDAETGSVLQVRSVLLTVAPIDDAPTLEPIPGQTVEAGGALVLQARASEVDAGQMVRYSLLEGPEDAWIDPISGLLVWRAAGPERRRFIVRAQEAQGDALFAEQAFEVQVRPRALPPLLIAPTQVFARPGEPLRLRIGSDGPGDRFFLGSEEPGATLNPATGQFSWTPSAKHARSRVRFQVTAVRGSLCTTTEFVAHVGALETSGSSAMRIGGGKAPTKRQPKRQP